MPRPDFAYRVVNYAVRKGYWVYVPTNGRLMRPEVIDRLGDAGVATFNVAVDSVADRKELPKPLDPIRRQEAIRVFKGSQKQHRSGFMKWTRRAAGC